MDLLMYRVPTKVILNISEEADNTTRIAKKIGATDCSVKQAIIKLIKIKLIERFDKYIKNRLEKRSKPFRLTTKGLFLRDYLQIIKDNTKSF